VSKTDPFLYPFEPGIFLANIGEYYLLFNKYPAVPQHVLLVTNQFQPQTDPLSLADFEAALVVMKELQGLVFFNSGEGSGYSQPHKHIQIIPLDKLGEVPLISVLQQHLTSDPFTLPQFQFQHRIQKLNRDASPSDLLSVYRSLFRELRVQPSVSYNLLMTQDWMAIVLREQDRAFNKFSFNSLAFAGLMLVKEPEDLDYLRRIGPLNALKDISVKL
jgi:ATP adenylyltransferase